MEAWCRCSVLWVSVFVDGVAVGPMVEADVPSLLVRMVSHFQFARPAVVLSLLDQMIFTPPVDPERRAMLPEVIVLSSSVRNAAARSCLFVSNAFLAAVAARAADVILALLGDLVGEDGVGVISSSDPCVYWSFRGECKIFLGEYSSVQALITS